MIAGGLPLERLGSSPMRRKTLRRYCGPYCGYTLSSVSMAQSTFSTSKDPSWWMGYRAKDVCPRMAREHYYSSITLDCETVQRYLLLAAPYIGIVIRLLEQS